MKILSIMMQLWCWGITRRCLNLTWEGQWLVVMWGRPTSRGACSEEQSNPFRLLKDHKGGLLSRCSVKAKSLFRSMPAIAFEMCLYLPMTLRGAWWIIVVMSMWYNINATFSFVFKYNLFGKRSISFGGYSFGKSSCLVELWSCPCGCDGCEITGIKLQSHSV